MNLGSASLLAALYFALSPRVAKGIYTNILFHPHPFPDENSHEREFAGVSYQDVFFKAGDGTLLHGWYFKQAESPFTVLLSHGNTGNIAGRPALLTALLETGVSLFVYDYRGYGKSQGSPSVDGVIADACAAYDYLVEKQGCRPDRVVLYGESLGAAVSCQLTLKRPSQGLILQSGFASITKISRHHIPLMHVYPAVLYPQPLLDSVAVLRRAHPPLLIVHGHKDSVVPFSHGKELFHSAVNRKYLVEFPDAEHSDIPIVAKEKFISAMQDFMQDLA